MMNNHAMNTCYDCKYHLPVDVFKGICKLTKATVQPGSTSCNDFERIPKCRFCSKFTPDKEFLGKCNETVLAYPDMIAINCTTFEWHVQN